MYSEVVHTFVNGFVTTKGPQIDALYKRFNSTFAEEEQYFAYLDAGLGAAVPAVTGGPRELQRGYMFQTLALIFIDRQFNLGLAAAAAEAAPEAAGSVAANPVDLGILIDALREPEAHPLLADFVEATKGTNVGKAKAVRFLYLGAAI